MLKRSHQRNLLIKYKTNNVRTSEQEEKTRADTSSSYSRRCQLHYEVKTMMSLSDLTRTWKKVLNYHYRNKLHFEPDF